LLQVSKVPAGETAHIHRLWILVLAVAIGGSMASGRAEAQSKLPPCSTSKHYYWNNCFGTFTFASGGQYVGEWKDDKPNGQGTYTSADGGQYVGEYKDNKRNGQGAYSWASGQKYVGEWKDDKQHGQGTYTFASGDQYVGEYKDDKKNGQGAYTWASGQKYVGEWKDDNQNGNGKSFAANGNLIRAGYWIAGEYFGSTPPAGYDVSIGSRIAMVMHGGTYTVPVLINGVLPLHFTIDSGASDVSIPSDVVSVLIRTGSLKDSDFIGSQKYVLADGSVITSRVFVIRSLKVGDQTITNVRGSVADANASLLLGQSFLGKFKSWSMDNSKHELVLE
jgi:hypothetical protein